MQTVDTTTTRAQEPQQPEFAPPQSPTPPGGEKKSRKGLILGVLAALGVLGFLAVLAVGALVLLFVVGGSTSSDEPVDRPADYQPVEQQPQQQPVGEPLSEDGSMGGLIQERVGDFALQRSEALPQIVNAGAADARELLYASPEGVEVVHQMTDWDSPDAADRMLREQTELYASDGYEQAEEFEVTDQDGQQIGSGVTLIGSDGEEMVLWANNDGFYVVIAPEGYGTDFYNNLEY